ncbi:MAG: hypothetical protein NVS3B16_24810 [Vulcanimicrobiaceae bacterium]
MTTDTPNTWTAEKARELRAQAYALLTRHDHGAVPRNDREEANLVRSNCGACVLNGYRDRDDDENHAHQGPNYAGWARIYTQAGLAIPRIWVGAFARELVDKDKNAHYAEALARDIATFGDPRPTTGARHSWVANGCRCHVVCMNCGSTSHNDPSSKVAVGVCGGVK